MFETKKWPSWRCRRHGNTLQFLVPEALKNVGFIPLLGAPILFNRKVIGVIQVSRKGGTSESAAPDFTSEHIGNLLALSKPLGRLVNRAVGE